MDGSWSEAEMRVYERNTSAHKVGLTPDEVAIYYSKWSENYEQDLCEGIYNGPTILAREMCDVYPHDRDTIRVLDVAAGTGLVGEKLYKFGFRKLSALDPAEGMLEVCRSKNIYQDYICQFLNGEQLPIHNDAYDCICVSGGMGESHLPRCALSEMIRIVKPGGHICIVMRKEYLETVVEYNEGKLEAAMDYFESVGKWRKIVRKSVKQYSFNKDGMVFIYQVV